MCDNVMHPKDINDLRLMHDEIVHCLNNASRPFCQKVVKSDLFRAGWN